MLKFILLVFGVITSADTVDLGAQFRRDGRSSSNYGRQISSRAPFSPSNNVPFSRSPQYPPESLQYSVSDAEFVGGSVYSDGSGIHVHRQPYSAYPKTTVIEQTYQSYPDQSVVSQHGNFRSEFQFQDQYPHQILDPFIFDQHLSFNSEYPSSINYGYPSYTTKYTGILTPRPVVDTVTVDLGVESEQETSQTSQYNLPGTAPQLMIPGTPYLPSSALGLGRVLPISDPYAEAHVRQPVQHTHSTNGLGRVLVPKKDQTSALLMFTLGRALGQLDKNNNRSSTPLIEKIFGMSKARVEEAPWKKRARKWDEPVWQMPNWLPQGIPGRGYLDPTTEEPSSGKFSSRGRGQWDRSNWLDKFSSRGRGQFDRSNWLDKFSSRGRGQWDLPAWLNNNRGQWDRSNLLDKLSSRGRGQWDLAGWLNSRGRGGYWQQPSQSDPFSWNQRGQSEWSFPQDTQMSSWFQQPSNSWSDNPFSNPWGPSYEPWWRVLFEGEQEEEQSKQETKPWWYELLKPMNEPEEED